MPHPVARPPTPRAPIQRLTYPLKNEAQPLTETKFTDMLNQWSQQAETGENRSEANWRILNCFKHKDQKLDLSNLGLKRLPTCIIQLTHLRHLTLTNNRLTALPPALHRLEHLEILDIEDNQFKFLPPQVNSLPNLQYLNRLGANAIPRMSKSHGHSNSVPLSRLFRLPSFSSLPTLAPIDFHHTVPDEMDEVHQRILHCFSEKNPTLKLSGLDLYSVPDELFYMTHLKELDLSNNNLLDLPVELSALGNLEILRLNNNEFTQLPDVIHEMKQLQHLNLNKNKIASLPENFWQNKMQLQTLGLRYNKLTTMPGPQVQELQSEIPGVPSIRGMQIEDRPKIQLLDLKGNLLETLPDTMAYLSWLTHIDLSKNQIENWPKCIDQMPALQKAYINETNTVNAAPASLQLPSQGIELSESITDETEFWGPMSPEARG